MTTAAVSQDQTIRLMQVFTKEAHGHDRSSG
jgi:hypothetical protein